MPLRTERLRPKLETTSLYAQVSIRELKRLHSALHPAATDLFNQLDEEAEEEEVEEG